MTRTEFLEELRETLAGKMTASEIQSHIDYYNSYINEEIGKGQTEADVLDELGSPFAIAKTLLMPYESETKTYESEQKEVTRNQTGMNDEAKKVLTIVIIITIALVVLSLVFGVISFVIRYAVPISIIALVVYFLKKK